eukprot:UN07036
MASVLRKIVSIEIDTANSYKLTQFGNFISKMSSIQNLIIPMKPSFDAYSQHNYIENEPYASMGNDVLSTISNIADRLKLHQSPSAYTITPAIALRRFFNIDDINHFMDSCKNQIDSNSNSNLDCCIQSVLIVGGPYCKEQPSEIDYDSFFMSQILQHHGIHKIYFAGYPEGNLDDNASITEQHSLRALQNKVMLAYKSRMEDINVITQLCLHTNAINMFWEKLRNHQLINKK